MNDRMRNDVWPGDLTESPASDCCLWWLVKFRSFENWNPPQVKCPVNRHTVRQIMIIGPKNGYQAKSLFFIRSEVWSYCAVIQLNLNCIEKSSIFYVHFNKYSCLPMESNLCISLYNFEIPCIAIWKFQKKYVVLKLFFLVNLSLTRELK